MSHGVPDARTWVQAQYRAVGIPLPTFRWVHRADFGAGVAASSALMVEDPELRTFLLLLDLEDTATPEALAVQVLADLDTAWSLRCACLPREGPGQPGAQGAWRVRIHWLGRADQRHSWRAAILHARQKGSWLDEIPVDATFRDAKETVATCLDKDGLPGLLLITRSVFRRDARATDLWASADGRVREALAGLEGAFTQPRARAIARELQDRARGEILPIPAVGPARPMVRLTVQDVRGVRDLTLEPWPGGSPVQAWVVSGPNGSGKSSLAEAVSLRAFGASPGLCTFLRDPDANRGRTPAGYLAHYLTPLEGGNPRCAFEGPPAPFLLAPDLGLALEAMAEAEGTLALQGGASAFLDTPGDELGTRMARSFSALATRLSAHVEAGAQAAGEARTALARRHGISASTRLLASFQDKIARALLGAALRPLPPGVAAYLACRSRLPGGGAAAALVAEPAPDRDALVRRLLRAETDPAILAGELRPTFVAQATRDLAVVAILDELRTRLATLPAPPAGLAAQASAWSIWLAQSPLPPIPPAPTLPPAELASLLAQRAALAEEGQRARPHRDHLEATLTFIRAHWREHPGDCPACGTALPQGAEATVAALLAEEDARLGARREAYAALTARIRALEQAPAEPGAPACPVAPEARRQIQAAVAALLGSEHSAEALLRDPATQDPLLRLLACAEAPPSAPALPGESAAEACATSIVEAWREAADILAEPEAWETVSRELTQRLTRVVAEHLPATLEALWRELAACLSPAPWLLPARARFQPRSHRGANQVTVVLETPQGEWRLARHLLNSAQRATLGLAWTFCQHLARGRFQHAWMLLDDPAQHLDQPAFRALCRFLATLLALYDAAGLPFTLLLLLNQEDRALDAAREVGQGLLVLGWTGQQEDAALQRIALFGETTRSPQPGDILAHHIG